MEDLVKKHQIPNVAMFSLSSENSYAGLGNGFHQKAWWAFVIADVMEDIRSMMLANSQDPEAAMEIFHKEWDDVLFEIEYGSYARLKEQLGTAAERFAQIPIKQPMNQVPVISLVGEIFVRRDGLSRQYLTETLAQKGFATVCAPIAEWMHYSDYLVDKGLVDYRMSLMEKLVYALKKRYMRDSEKTIKSILSRSGLIHNEPVHVESIINKAIPYISPNLAGEAILTVGSSLSEVASYTCGAIAIGPFGCMPNRMSESILNETMNREGKLATDPHNEKLRTMLTEIEDLPFLAIESDGSPFPQLINAKLETFCLRAERLH
jgi:predicted nucleotide-binding protein (sugar kinase/HSP70/actin superfamily)